MTLVQSAGRDLAAGLARPTRSGAEVAVERAVARDLHTSAVRELPATLQGLVRVAFAASRSRVPGATEAAFVSAGRAAYAQPIVGRAELSHALQIARLAKGAPQAGEAVHRILEGAHDRFTDYVSRRLIASTAQQLGDTGLHRRILQGLATYAPSSAEHVKLGGELAAIAQHDPTYAPLVGLTLARANDRATSLADARAVQAAAQALHQDQTGREAAAVARRLRARGWTGPGRYRPEVDRVLADVRSPDYSNTLAALGDGAIRTDRFARETATWAWQQHLPAWAATRANTDATP